jgi:starch synthase
LQLTYDETLAHRIYAALDFALIPSHFEPCGLTQLIAMRYGVLPIVRSTGGLKDTVFDCDDYTVSVRLRNGFTFLDPKQLPATLERAFALQRQDPATFQLLLKRGMQFDCSWKKPALQYLKLYRSLVATEQKEPNYSVVTE